MAQRRRGRPRPAGAVRPGRSLGAAAAPRGDLGGDHRPQEKSPKGDRHTELAVYSYDRERKTIALREFYSEGYVARSTCAVEPKRIVCTAESVESGPGMQARLTVRVADAYSFEEVFELAWPGEEPSVYFTNHWRRVPDLDD